MEGLMRRASLALSAIVIALIVLLPQILSTPLGSPFFIRILEKKLHAEIAIQKLSLSWLGPQVFRTVQYRAEGIDGAIEEVRSEVPLWFLSELKGSFLLKNGSFALNGVKVEQVNAELKNNALIAKGKPAQGGHFSIQGQVYTEKDFDVTAEITALPVIAIDSLLKIDGLCAAVLGDTLNLKGKATLHQAEGVLEAFISSTYLTTNIHAKLSDEALTLKEPIKAVWQLTEPLSERLINSFNPLLLTGVRAKNPIVLNVGEKGFSLNKPFSLKTLTIKTGSLNMGQIECQSGPSLNSLLSLFKRTSVSSKVNVWLTPVFFQLEKGVLELDRTDALLADSIHVCTWGSIDLPKDSLHMFLGIPADTLNHLFSIKNVHPNYVLKIPIRGSVRDPEMDTGPAAAKIAKMAASQQIPKAKKFLNPLIHVFSSVQEEGDAPPPKSPFPWKPQK